MKDIMVVDENNDIKVTRGKSAVWWCCGLIIARQHALHAQRPMRGPITPKFLRPPIYAHIVWHTTTKFCTVIKLMRTILTGSTTSPIPGQIYFAALLTRDMLR